MSLLSDVNLDAINFSIDGKDITLNFLDMYELKPLMDIKCLKVYMFNFQNTFEDDDGFACYIGEVNCEVVKRDALSMWLKRNRFRFSGSTGDIYLPGEGDLNNLSLYSGEVTIDILCQDVVATKR